MEFFPILADQVHSEVILLHTDGEVQHTALKLFVPHVLEVAYNPEHGSVLHAAVNKAHDAMPATVNERRKTKLCDVSSVEVVEQEASPEGLASSRKPCHGGGVEEVADGHDDLNRKLQKK